jgi:uncharacterized sulfatase
MNILLITSDQHHFRALGKLNSHIKTPNLDRLANEGMLFERGYTVNPVCTPSRVSILTGHYPSKHGCYHVGTSLPEDYQPTISSQLANAGYYTALLGKAHFNACLDPNSFEARPNVEDLDKFRSWDGPFYGFQHAKLLIGHTSEVHASGMHYGAWLEDQGIKRSDYFGIHGYNEYGTWSLPEDKHGSRWIADETIDAINAAQEESKPFFLWSSFQDPHNPYVVPEPWASMYDPKTIPLPEDLDCSMEGKPHFYDDIYSHRPCDDPDLQNIRYDCRNANHITLEKTKELYAVYYGMISLMDHHIGRVLDVLDENGLTEKTLIVFTSDHGDYLGNHNLWGKGLLAYEDIQRVPFIVRHPQCKTPGVNSKSLQSLIDLEASFLSAAGLPQPDGSQGVDQTNSWLNVNQKVRDWVMLECTPTESNFCQHTFIENRYKLILYHDRAYGELYDLHEDPNQSQNLYDDILYRDLRNTLIKRYISAEMERKGILRKRTAGA